MLDHVISWGRDADPRSAASFVLDLLSTLRRGCDAGARPGRGGGALRHRGGQRPRRALAPAARTAGSSATSAGLYRLGAPRAAGAERVAAWRDLDGAAAALVGRLARRSSTLAPAPRPRAQARAAANARCACSVSGRSRAGSRCARTTSSVESTQAAGGARRARPRTRRRRGRPLVLDAVSDARARTLWDGDALVASYRRHRQATRRRACGACASRAPEQAMVESFRVGGAALRALALDPLLPEPIVATAERDALVETLSQLRRGGPRELVRLPGTPRRAATARRPSTRGRSSEEVSHDGSQPRLRSRKRFPISTPTPAPTRRGTRASRARRSRSSCAWTAGAAGSRSRSTGASSRRRSRSRRPGPTRSP